MKPKCLQNNKFLFRKTAISNHDCAGHEVFTTVKSCNYLYVICMTEIVIQKELK